MNGFDLLILAMLALFAALGLADGEEGARLSLDAGEYGRS